MSSTRRRRAPEPPTSDALIVNLLLQHDFTLRDLTNFFTILRSTSPNSHAPTLQHAVDVYHTITSYRGIRTVGHQRTRPQGMPQVVLEAVIQVLLDERPPFDYTTLGLVLMPVAVYEKTIMNMSHVHRSWTVHAQRALAVRIHIRGIEGIRAALTSASVGPWSQEVCFKWRTTPEPRGVHHLAVQPPEPTLSELALLLQRVGSVRLLSISTCLDGDDESMFTLVRSLGLLTCLEGLWLENVPASESTPTRPCRLLAELLNMLPSLRRLKFLSVRGWSVSEEWASRDRLPRTNLPNIPHERRLPPPPPLSLSTSPPPTLKSITISFGDFAVFPSAYAEWIFRSRGDYKLDAVSLHLQRRPNQPGEDLNGDNSSADLISVHDEIFKWLGNVGTVQCRIDQHEIAYPIGGSHDRTPAFAETLQRAVENFRVARRLRLHVIGSPMRRLPRELGIPRYVEELHIRYTRNRNSREYISDVYKGLDETLSLLLERRALPRLRLLTVTCDNSSQSDRLQDTILRSAAGLALVDIDDSNGHLLPRTKMVCRQHSIEFVYTENPFLYHFFTME